MDLVVEGRAWYKGKLQHVCIGIEHGRISRVKKALKGERHLDFNDRIILPGAIDVHTHMREPGMTRKEDFSSGTTAAAFGGVTCVFDMPNTKPPSILREDVMEKKELASKKAWVDFGLFGGVSDASNPLRIADQVVGFKIYMSSTTGAILLPEDKGIKRAMGMIKSTGKVVSVHAEDEDLIAKLDEASIKDHAQARPTRAEGSAIERLAQFSRQNKVNVCHVSSREGIEALAKGEFTSEATPHHMLLDLSSCARKGFCKVNPPLRPKADKEALLAAFAAGKITLLASDHAPHTIEEKELEFEVAPSGVPGVETSFPLMMALARKEQVGLGTLVKAACEMPAQVFGLRKGVIEEGRDADLMVLDPREVTSISARRLHSKCGWTPFEGHEAIFPQAVFLRGQLLIEEGGLVGERNGRDVVARHRVPA
ncbi:MAG TPA: dihydroorotase [Methanomassiliicoccales archaeon]|nr:dihydroorotase [Methanomassiliicoccales archaeon]